MSPPIVPNPGVPALPGFMRQGLIAFLVCSTLSLVATFSVLVHLIYKELRGFYFPHNRIPLAPRTDRVQGYFWLFNLFAAGFIQALGRFLVIHTLIENSVFPGAFCNFQGVMINIGDVSAAMFSFVIALHTFLLLAGGRKWQAWVTEFGISGKGRWIVAGSVWFSTTFIATCGLFIVQKIHPERGPFFNNAEFGWCWIDKNNFYERLFFHYIFLFIDDLGLTLIYFILCIYIHFQAKRFRTATMNSSQGTGSHELQNRSHHTSDAQGTGDQDFKSKQANSNPASNSQATHRRMTKVAYTLLLYPVLYIFHTLPPAIIRLASFGGFIPSYGVLYFVASVYCCSGWTTVLLYAATRKGIISWDRQSRQRRGSAPLLSPSQV